jgi:hypothetical protein
MAQEDLDVLDVHSSRSGSQTQGQMRASASHPDRGTAERQSPPRTASRFALVCGDIGPPIASCTSHEGSRHPEADEKGWVGAEEPGGSHRHFVHPVKPGDDTPGGTAKAILKQAGVRE